jgi:hypothetical protein
VVVRADAQDMEIQIADSKGTYKKKRRNEAPGNERKTSPLFESRVLRRDKPGPFRWRGTLSRPGFFS